MIISGDSFPNGSILPWPIVERLPGQVAILAWLFTFRLPCVGLLTVLAVCHSGAVLIAYVV